MIDKAMWMRRSASEPPSSTEPRSWTLALAGGDGARLSEYVLRRFGAAIPKQYCALLGKRTMLEHTLDRLNKTTPASRTLTVIGTDHSELAMPQLNGRSDHVFRQPSSRDTGVAVYVALAMIKRWAPNAIVTITPTDHYVTPAETFLEHVRTARQVAARMHGAAVIIGAEPTEPDPDFGYLCLGARASDVPRVSSVLRFSEKPSVSTALQLCKSGALWNTMITCGTVDALWQLGREADPALLDILDSLVPLIGTPDEDEGIEYVYRTALPVSFSRDILERVPERLLALQLRDVEWSDWGRPERIEMVLALHRSRVRT
jgi:mannose-1-phosphate guanylyltransferase